MNKSSDGNPYWCEECEEVPHKDWCVRGMMISLEDRRRQKNCLHPNRLPESVTNICPDCGGAIRVIPCNPQGNK